MKYCTKCGAELEQNASFCIKCGVSLHTQTSQIAQQNQTYSTQTSYMRCPRCNSSNINVQMVAQNKKTGCLIVFLYILLAITIVGIPIMLLISVVSGKKTVTKKYYVCQSCGHNW